MQEPSETVLCPEGFLNRWGFVAKITGAGDRGSQSARALLHQCFKPLLPRLGALAELVGVDEDGP